MHLSKLLILWALIATLSMACGGAAQPTPDGNRITVEEVVNRVETNRTEDGGAEPDFLPAEIGQELFPGAEVKTFRDSEARVDIRVQELIRIIRTTPNTVWRLGQFAVERETIIELDQGKIFLLDDGLLGDRRPFKVVTPAGTASPRGTIWSVEFDPVSGIVEVECFRGICEVANSLGIQSLTDGQRCSATADTAPTPPQPIDQENQTRFARLPEIISGEIQLPVAQAALPIQTPAATEAPASASHVTPTRIATPTPKPVADLVVQPPISELAYGGTVQGAIDIASGRDVYAFQARAGDQVTLVLEHGGNPGDLWVYAPDGSEIDPPPPSCHVSSSPPTYPPHQHVTYLVLVDADVTTTFPYTLHLGPNLQPSDKISISAFGQSVE